MKITKERKYLHKINPTKKSKIQNKIKITPQVEVKMEKSIYETCLMTEDIYFKI